MASEEQAIATIPKNSREEVRITIGTYRGVERIDIRTFADINGLGVYVATKKGISLRLDQLPELVTALQQAAAEVQRCKLLTTRERVAA